MHKRNWPLFYFTYMYSNPMKRRQWGWMLARAIVVLLIKTFFQWQIILSNVWWIIMNVGFVNIYVLLGQQSGGRLWFIARRTISICKAAIQIVNMLKWNICKHFAHYICSTSGWQQPGARWDERGPIQFWYLLMYQVVICGRPSNISSVWQ